MKELEQLEQEWLTSQPLRGDMDKFLRGKAWGLASELVASRAVEGAERHLRGDGDAILARGLSFQKGARWAIKQLQGLTKPVEENTQKYEEPYDYINEKYLEEKRKSLT